ncbi:MAG: DUF1521 domain-containing protein [Chitinophagaceae bacterium]|nr:DUF1521 domain-containing protein [Rubrivivax sp.]
MRRTILTTMPTFFANIMAGGCVRPPAGPRCGGTNPSNASTGMQGGSAVFENDSYRITAGDNNEVLIHNKNTGETYRAWGDPHMEIDGKQAFDFWGTTSFLLDDGTKVTIETTPWAGDPSMTLSSKVTISNGDYGVQITGVDTNTQGDLQIDEGIGWGHAVDWAVDDGNVVYENRFGSGFVAVDCYGNIRSVDQSYINETDLLKGGAMQKPHLDAFRLLSGLLTISFFGVFLSSLAVLSLTTAARTRDDETGRPELADTLRSLTWDSLELDKRPAARANFALTLARWGMPA